MFKSSAIILCSSKCWCTDLHIAPACLKARRATFNGISHSMELGKPKCTRITSQQKKYFQKCCKRTQKECLSMGALWWQFSLANPISAKQIYWTTVQNYWSSQVQARMFTYSASQIQTSNFHSLKETACPVTFKSITYIYS